MLRLPDWIESLLICVMPVIVIGIHLRFDMLILCTIAYCISMFMSMWVFLNANGDVGRFNIILLLIFHGTFAAYFTFKTLAEIGLITPTPTGPDLTKADLRNIPVLSSFMIMSELIYSGVYALLLRDKKIKLIDS